MIRRRILRNIPSVPDKAFIEGDKKFVKADGIVTVQGNVMAFENGHLRALNELPIQNDPHIYFMAQLPDGSTQIFIQNASRPGDKKKPYSESNVHRDHKVIVEAGTRAVAPEKGIEREITVQTREGPKKVTSIGPNPVRQSIGPDPTRRQVTRSIDQSDVSVLKQPLLPIPVLPLDQVGMPLIGLLAAGAGLVLWSKLRKKPSTQVAEAEIARVQAQTQLNVQKEKDDLIQAQADVEKAQAEIKEAELQGEVNLAQVIVDEAKAAT